MPIGYIILKYQDNSSIHGHQYSGILTMLVGREQKKGIGTQARKALYKQLTPYINNDVSYS